MQLIKPPLFQESDTPGQIKELQKELRLLIDELNRVLLNMDSKIKNGGK